MLGECSFRFETPVMTIRGQSMKSQSQSCITPVFNEASTSRREDRRSVAKVNRARQLEIEDRRQRIALMEATVAGFDRTASELEEWIRVEQNRSGIHDPAHFAYSTSAIAMTLRRDALMRSREILIRAIDELKRQLTEADVHA
jgi:hypothetical protein